MEPCGTGHHLIVNGKVYLQKEEKGISALFRRKNRRVELNWLSKPGQRLIMISVPCNFTFSFLDLLLVSGNAMARRIKCFQKCEQLKIIINLRLSTQLIIQCNFIYTSFQNALLEDKVILIRLPGATSKKEYNSYIN